MYPHLRQHGMTSLRFTGRELIVTLDFLPSRTIAQVKERFQQVTTGVEPIGLRTFKKGNLELADDRDLTSYGYGGVGGVGLTVTDDPNSFSVLVNSPIKSIQLRM